MNFGLMDFGLLMGMALFILVAGAVLTRVVVPGLVSGSLIESLARVAGSVRRFLKVAARYGGEQGGYVHDTAMSQYIGPNMMHYVTGTWTQAAGQVAGTIAMHKAANAETAVVNIPIVIPSNSVAQKGAYLKSIEVDYELLAAAATSVTATLNKVTRGADTAVAVVAAATITQDLAAGTAAATQDQHKLTVTLTTPAWIDNDEYYLLKLAFVCGGTVTIDVLGAVANFTYRI